MVESGAPTIVAISSRPGPPENAATALRDKPMEFEPRPAPSRFLRPEPARTAMALRLPARILFPLPDHQFIEALALFTARKIDHQMPGNAEQPDFKLPLGAILMPPFQDVEPCFLEYIFRRSPITRNR